MFIYCILIVIFNGPFVPRWGLEKLKSPLKMQQWIHKTKIINVH